MRIATQNSEKKKNTRISWKQGRGARRAEVTTLVGVKTSKKAFPQRGKVEKKKAFSGKESCGVYISRDRF